MAVHICMYMYIHTFTYMYVCMCALYTAVHTPPHTEKSKFVYYIGSMKKQKLTGTAPNELHSRLPQRRPSHSPALPCLGLMMTSCRWLLFLHQQHATSQKRKQITKVHIRKSMQLPLQLPQNAGQCFIGIFIFSHCICSARTLLCCCCSCMY